MKKLLKLAFFISLTVLGSCDQTLKRNNSANYADAIYYGGDIVTMEGDSATYAEAVAIKDGKIVFVGSKAAAEKMKGDSTVMNDLQGNTLVPGFIDGHAHFAGFGAQAVGANLLASPDGNVNDIDGLINELKTWYAKNGTDKSKGWIYGMGFDDAVLKKKDSLQKKIWIKCQKIFQFALFIYQVTFVL